LAASVFKNVHKNGLVGCELSKENQCGSLKQKTSSHSDGCVIIKGQSIVCSGGLYVWG